MCIYSKHVVVIFYVCGGRGDRRPENWISVGREGWYIWIKVGGVVGAD